MANSFPRTTRSLKMDSFQLSMTGLIFSILLVLAWMGWFFLAPISLYEASNEVKMQDDGSFLVQFPAAKVERMAAGQNAIVQFEGKFQVENKSNSGGMSVSSNGVEERTLSSQALVMKVVPADKSSQQGQVELALLDDVFYNVVSQQPNGASGIKLQAQVEIESVTPFVLVQRAARQYFAGAAQLPGGPQNH